MLQQDPLDVGAFTVLENFVYGREAKAGVLGRLFPDMRRAEGELRQVSNRFGFSLEPQMRVADLSIAGRQQLEIVRLLAQGVRALILDEPTTGISADQKDVLFATLRDLAQEGMTILLVSHKLEDVIALCDEVAVLRAGQVVGQAEMPATKAQLVEMMFGQELQLQPRVRRDLSSEPVLLEVNDLAITDGRLHMEDLALQVRRGEVIGFAGLDGSGQELFMRACAGLISPVAGKIHLLDRDMTGRGYQQFRAGGVVFGSAGRLEEGLVAGLTLTEHVALVEDDGLLIDWQGARASTNAKISQYQIRGKADYLIEQLSGGNQQRVLMSLLPSLPGVMILEQPMRGLDVDSAAWIWKHLLLKCDSGSALLFSSADLDELVQYSDRIVVCYAGKMKLVENPAEVTVNQLGHFIGGEFEWVS
jgi:simple sugar transport system ATP-binding protein